MPMQVTLLQLQARLGRRDEAIAGLAALERQAASEKLRLTHRDRAYVMLALGDQARACDEFERSFEERDSGLMWLSVIPASTHCAAIAIPGRPQAHAPFLTVESRDVIVADFLDGLLALT